jgi:hypothetical protein
MTKHHSESGNAVFFILLGIVLIGLVTAAIRSGGDGNSNIDREETLVNASRVKQYASELERAVVFILTSGTSEEDIRFAHGDAPSDYGNINTNPQMQVFHPQGGGAEYKMAPEGINDGSPWEFYGHTNLPEVGSDQAELIAVLPNVTDTFCRQINKMDGYDPATTPTDTGAGADNCLNSGALHRFNDTAQYTTIPNTADDTTFSVKPAMEGCVKCSAGGNHFFHVLHVR